MWRLEAAAAHNFSPALDKSEKLEKKERNCKKMKKVKRLEIIKKMPPLYHSFPETEFNIFESAVVKWIISQPQILQYLFDKAHDYMRYDPTTGKWEGVDYRDN